jgi:DEAD/DEAH box helicase domain-containing protein
MAVTLDQFVDHILHTGVGPAELRYRLLPGRPARLRPFPDLHPRLAAALEARGIRQLYCHQVEAFQAARAGRDWVVVTPTASGKTLCYNLPVLDALARGEPARALYLFPTKALAQDQRAELVGWLQALGNPGACHTYDGDTPAATRTAVREAGHLILTNPDMLHAGILPHHARWVRLFENLRFVVIDELHTYRGVFGSHLANVLRRLERVAAFYGSRPLYLCASATVGNPRELAGRLLGRPVQVIDQSGAPAGPRHFFFYNPPVVNPTLGVRRGAAGESVAWARRLLQEGISTIVFARSRLQVELVLSALRRDLDPALAARVRGYRGGYLPRERRAIERGLREGTVRGIVSTNALELGIDVGALQAAVLCGYPGSIASTWQQAGRAGRRQEASLVVLVAGNHPLDQFLVTNPDYLLGQPPEAAFLNPENLYVLMGHLKCAAFELPFRVGEAFGPGPTDEMLAFLAEERVLRQAGGAYHWMAEHFPAADTSLRGGDGNVVIVDRTQAGAPRVVGEVDQWSAMLTVYEGAIYLHEGVQYQVETYDEPARKAYVRQVQVDYYTDADLAVHLKVLDVLRAEGAAAPPVQMPDAEPQVLALRGPAPAPPSAGEETALDAGALGTAGDAPRILPAGAGPCGRAWGEVLVTAKATVFKKIRLETGENVGWGKIHLPERQIHTTAYWASFPPDLEGRLGRERLGGGLAGLARALVALAPLYLLCDAADLQALPQVRSPFSGLPTIYLWEVHAGGVGLAEKAFEAHPHLWAAVAERVAGCACASGCPSCVGPGTDAKAAGLEILAAVGLGRSE